MLHPSRSRRRFGRPLHPPGFRRQIPHHSQPTPPTLTHDVTADAVHFPKVFLVLHAFHHWERFSPHQPFVIVVQPVPRVCVSQRHEPHEPLNRLLFVENCIFVTAEGELLPYQTFWPTDNVLLDFEVVVDHLQRFTGRKPYVRHLWIVHRLGYLHWASS